MEIYDVEQNEADAELAVHAGVYRPDRFAKATESGADVLIIDLEDAVSPDDKPKARAAAVEYLSGSAPNATSRALRINGLDTAAGIADLDTLLASSAVPDFLVLPKADSPGHLHILDRLLTARKLETRLVGLIESARGLAAVEATAAATPRLFGLMLGAADMAADLGVATLPGTRRLWQCAAGSCSLAPWPE